MRPLEEKEANLVKCLLKNTNYEHLDLSGRMVEDMEDGGMGSIKFIASDDQQGRSAKQVAELLFEDSDNIPISVSVNVDQYGDLFELDIWRVDFNPVQRYPDCSRVVGKTKPLDRKKYIEGD